MLSIAIYALRGLAKIRSFRIEDVGHERLRFAINNGKPRALYLHHDPMAFQERVIVGMQVNFVFQWLARRDCFRPLK